MSPRARDVLNRVMWRVAQDYGRALADVSQLERSGNVGTGRSLYSRARVWKQGTYQAWIQLKILIDTGQVKDPWKPTPANEVRHYVS